MRGPRQPLGAGEDEGFTLVELMTVLLVLGVLMAVAVPTFLHESRLAEDRAAEADLHSALAAAVGVLSDNGYRPVTASALSAAEPDMSFTDQSVSAPPAVSVASTSDGAGELVVLGDMSANGRCLYLDYATDAGEDFGESGAQASCPVGATPQHSSFPTAWSTQGWGD